MRKILPPPWALALGASGLLLLGAAGCSETIRTTLNPDGSGKIEYTEKIPPVQELAKLFFPGGKNPPSTETFCRMLVEQMMTHAKGFEVWAYSDYAEDHDATVITFTGYFRDYGQIDFDLSSLGVPARPAAARPPARDEKGRWIIALSTPRNWELPPGQTPAAAPPAGKEEDDDDDDDALAEMREMRAYALIFFKHFDGLMGKLPEEYAERYEVVVGGRIVESEGMTIDGKATAWTTSSLRDSWKFTRQILTDDGMMKAMAQEMSRQGVGMWGIDWSRSSLESLALVRSFIQQHNPSWNVARRLVVEPGQPVFDYAKETADAWKRPGPLVRRLRADEGAALIHSPPPEPGAPLLGMQLGAGSAAPVIARVAPGSPAEGSGLRPGDRIVKVDGADVGSVAEARDMIETARPGQKVPIIFLRGGSRSQVEVTPVPAELAGGRK